MKRLSFGLAILVAAFVASSGLALALDFVVVEDTEFDAVVTVRGPTVQIKSERSSKGNANDFDFNLLTTIDKKAKRRADAVSVFHLYSGTDWHFFDRVSDDQATELKFVKGIREVAQCFGGRECIYYEKFGASLPKGYLERRKEGFRLRLRSQRAGDMIIEITAEQVGLQLDAIKQRVAK